METPLLEGAHKVSHVLGPRAKAVTSQEPRLDLLAGLGGSPGEGVVAVALPWDVDMGGGDFGECAST